MPKSRTKNVATPTVPLPLFESLRAQMQSVTVQNNDTESDTDNFKGSASGWQCDIEDWSEKKTSTNGRNMFPKSLRSIEKQNEQTKNNFFQFDEHESKPVIKEQFNEPTNNAISKDIDVSKLSLILNDLIIGKRDESAYTDFLLILQRFNIHASRDDRLEETVYHLIQAAVSFIRSNEQRFDLSKLEECYHQRYIHKKNSLQ